ncbi:ADOP family duplicated permease [Silvibacterium sp.]|uniref:ADOP family duplicated permease n=1 Tax=Silvibacterium sp. TaxID=1964179 RepID=UPI0039E38F9F
MSWLRRIFHRRELRADLLKEMQTHLAERVQDLIASGIPEGEATQQARRELGNLPLAYERSVEIWQFRLLESLWSDLRGTLFQLRKAPGYALTAILTLALGIGANAAIFTVIDDAMLRSLPVEKPQELVELGYRNPAVPQFINVQIWSVITHLSGELHSASDIAGWTGSMVTFPDDQNTLRSFGADMVTGNAFSMLGIRPALGRLLLPSDDVPGGPEGGWPIVLDYGFWQANFRGDPSAIGRHLLVSGQPAVIVGVLPQNFDGIYVGQPQRIFLPAHFLSALATSPDQDPYKHPDMLGMQTLARLRPGATLDSLNAELAALNTPAMHALLSPRLQQNPTFRDAHLAAESASRGFSALSLRYAQPLFLIQGIAAAVLVLCCLNLAGLQTARLQSRRQEFALRSTLGASRSRIAQQCLVESLVLALLGGACAIAIAWSSIRTLTGFFTPAGNGDPMVLKPDLRILAIAGAISLLTTLLFGFLPALFAVRIPAQSLLRSKSTGTRRDTLRSRILIPGQFALAVALVFAAGLFTHTLRQLRDTPLGFDPEHITGVTAQFQALKKTPEQIIALYQTMETTLRSAPGIQAVAYTWYTPITGESPKITASSSSHPDQDHSFRWNDVSDGYFSAMHSRILAGREFTVQDRDRSACIVNQSAARTLFPGEAALANSLHVSEPENIRNKFNIICRVIGIVEDARYASLRDPAPPTVYFPIGTSTVEGGGYNNNLVFFMRSRTEGEAISAYRGALADDAPNTGYMTFFALTHQIDQSIGSERLIATLSSSFAALALLLSSIGLFGLLALRVQQRLPEIGVRLAVGATRRNILNLVLQEALLMVAIGTGAGIVLIAITSATMRRFLYNTSPLQAEVVLGSLLLLATAALLAALVPARRAAWLDPARVLRAE